MPPALRDGRSRRDPSVARALSLVLAAVALLVLVGWVIGEERLTALTPDDDPMKPNTALCLLLLAASVLRAQMPNAPVLQNVWTTPGAVLALNLAGGSQGSVYGAAASFSPDITPRLSSVRKETGARS